MFNYKLELNTKYGIRVRVVEDSVSEAGVRLVTLELRCHRYILAEINTHRMMSKSTASSRAIPLAKRIDAVMNDPALPVRWGANQKGMAAGVEMKNRKWLSWGWRILGRVVAIVARLFWSGLHKQVASRPLEPWLFAETVLSSTEWDNFLSLRTQGANLDIEDVHERIEEALDSGRSGVQPEMLVLALLADEALKASEPVAVGTGGWHLPYVAAGERGTLAARDQVARSVARCARVSYEAHGDSGKTLKDDQERYHAIVEERHDSALEHTAMALGDGALWGGNFRGWLQDRQHAHGEPPYNKVPCARLADR